MSFRVLGIRRPEFFQRPRAGLDAAALGVLVPIHRAHMLARFEIRKLRILVMKKNHVVIAAGARTAAPLGAGVGDEAAILGNFAD